MNIKWNVENYTDNFEFVHKYGEDVTGLIDAPEGSFVVDLGCGNGALSAFLSDKGYKVTGIDASADMVKKARELHSDLRFECGDVLDFCLEEPADVIFSNAVMHWIDAEKQSSAAQNIYSNLKPGGYFVCEFGGKGCAEAVHSELEKLFCERGIEYKRTFYFPSLSEYTSILENAGFEVKYAVIFDRPTVQKTDNGIIDWIRMFDTKPFEGMNSDEADIIMKKAQDNLKEKLFKDGKWIVDYVRIRIKAQRPVKYEEYDGDDLSEKERMLRGMLYNPADNELAEMRKTAHKLCTDYNVTYEDDEGRNAILDKLMPHRGKGTFIQGPVQFDYGVFIETGENFYANFNFTVLDCCPVKIGDNVMIGPNVSLLTPVHPMCWQDRNIRFNENGSSYDYEYARPIEIGDNCWIAGNVTVCGGVKIGSGSVIGAGSVVTRDIPPDSLAVGNPCRVIRKITAKDRMTRK